jgi:large subunit ribosomal protein L29
MKTKELRELTPAELTARLRELKEEMRHLRIQQSTEQLENPARIRTVRREIARVETFAAQRAAKA